MDKPQRDPKTGRLLKGNTANPNGRPPSSPISRLKDAQQKAYLEFFYALLQKTPKEIQALTGADSSATNMERAAARLIYDVLKGGKADTYKIFLGLLGFDVRNVEIAAHIARYVVTPDGQAPAGEEEVDDSAYVGDEPNIHLNIVKLIKDLTPKSLPPPTQIKSELSEKPKKKAKK